MRHSSGDQPPSCPRRCGAAARITRGHTSPGTATQPVLGRRLRFIKEAVIEGMNLPLERGLQFERKTFQVLFATADKTEGMRARLEKRPANFAGLASPPSK